MKFKLHSEDIFLAPERALDWLRRRTLLVADAHFGKAASYRAKGMPVPEGTTADNLRRLDAAIDRHGAERVIFLGDFMHDAHAHNPRTLAALRDWRARRRQLALVLVGGNHDAKAGALPVDLGIDERPEGWREEGFAFCHHPCEIDGAYVLAGHLHPAWRLATRREGLRLPCFHFGARTGVLPAFGDFTGGMMVDAAPGDAICVVTPERVFAVPRAAAGDAAVQAAGAACMAALAPSVAPALGTSAQAQAAARVHAAKARKGEPETLNLLDGTPAYGRD
ncbi:ligase-associated DNA damage response endonuclease PdeM [Derxia gummosa]|uniref:Ligase-associated DNA damage response endonuclease PdeM n=1 Tax=Derxia gummosa DSM 723 TaxID=1121388 RepID=A0A8B6XBK1_9BURK|nr:ligase-associated DNA damage response endonuclease PdeM [Derxia gummosa]